MIGNKINEKISVSGQISGDDVRALAADGIEIIVCNRPDNESSDQVPFQEIADVANELGVEIHHIPFSGSGMSARHVDQFAPLLATGKSIHLYCRTGNRSNNLYQSTIGQVVSDRAASKPQTKSAMPHYDVVVIGAGSSGIAVASSLLARRRDVRILLVDPASEHYYQPGWTLVGAGEMTAAETRRETKSLIPAGVTWRKQAAVKIVADEKFVELDDGARVGYRQLIVCPGLVLDWDAIEGLSATLGKNGVTSNYRFDLAPYTWELVANLQSGKAIFTQPAMPIKCAGAPQKAMYLSADHWRRHGRLKDIDLQFHTVTPGLFGVADFVPVLTRYCEQYQVEVNTQSQLVRIDGERKLAWFASIDANGDSALREESFEMIHVCPPQRAPGFIQTSGLADDQGWLSVDSGTLQSTADGSIWGVGDVISAANAKTMAAARKQVRIVAEQVTAALNDTSSTSRYDATGPVR